MQLGLHFCAFTAGGDVNFTLVDGRPDRRISCEQGHHETGSGLVLDIVLGIVGALVGGFMFNSLGHVGPTGINLHSIFVVFIGAVIVLVIYHAVCRRCAL